MLEELQSKIEASHERLTKLTNDIERMRSIEDALVETDQSIAASANDLKSFVDAASSTHQSLIDAADAFKDAANTLGMIDVVKLSEAINAGNDQIRAEILRTEAKSSEELESARQDLKTFEKRVTDSVTTSGESILNQVRDATTELDATTRSTIAPVKWVGALTLLTSIAVLVIAVLIFLND